MMLPEALRFLLTEVLEPFEDSSLYPDYITDYGLDEDYRQAMQTVRAAAAGQHPA